MHLSPRLSLLKRWFSCCWFDVDCYSHCGILWLFYVLLCVTLCPYWFCNHLDGEEGAGFFTLFVFLVSRDCCVALPHDASGLSAVCDCSISWSYSLSTLALLDAPAWLFLRCICAYAICTEISCTYSYFVWFDSLRPINNLSVKQGRVFLG